MPSLRLLNYWPWGCARTLADLPPVTNLANNYWLSSDLTDAMKWFYKVRSWTYEVQFLLNGLPSGAAVSGTYTHAGDELEAVCGRQGIQIDVSGTGIVLADYVGASRLQLFAPQIGSIRPGGPSPEPLLRYEHSVLQEGAVCFTFCRITATISRPTGGFTVTDTQSTSTQANTVTVDIDGQQAREATTDYLGSGLTVYAQIRPSAFYSFS